MNSDYQKFRNEYPCFIYKNYRISDLPTEINITYDFEILGLAEFHPQWSFPKPSDSKVIISNNKTFERLAFSLGMAEAVSYWKAACSPEIRVQCGELSDEQIKWWKKLYFLGLGEFFYVNGIETDADSFVDIKCSGEFSCADEIPMNSPQGCLVPIGGGKDSALTIETLMTSGINCTCYSINARRSITETVRAAGLPESSLFTAKRMFDRSLVKLNSRGFLNGHTPFSAIVAFSAEIAAYLNEKKYIVLSNESSANENTVAGLQVNHQYSKSFEFEKDFHFYEERFLKTGAYYFSFLRPLTEFQIAAMFVKYKKYLPIFKSCNLGSKVSPDIWCTECPKCLFVSLILSPFLTQEELTAIFGKNLINDSNMLEYFIELTGHAEHKPFECVGSIDEVNLAVSAAIRNYLENNIPLPFLFKKYAEAGFYNSENIDAELGRYLSTYDGKNLLPEEFESILKNEMERLL